MSENSELAMLRLNYEIKKLKQFVYAAEQSEQEAVEIIAELKAENAKLKEENFKLGQIDTKKVTLVENRQLEEENAKLKEKYQEELTVNTQLQEWQDEDLRQITELKRELEQANEWNKTLWQKLEKIKEYVSQLKVFEFIKEDLLSIIEGAADETND